MVPIYIALYVHPLYMVMVAHTETCSKALAQITGMGVPSIRGLQPDSISKCQDP